MASKGRYVKLTAGPAEKVTGKQSTVGAVVIADYVDGGIRTLVVERPLTVAGHRATKPKVKARPKPQPPRVDIPHPVEVA